MFTTELSLKTRLKCLPYILGIYQDISTVCKPRDEFPIFPPIRYQVEKLGVLIPILYHWILDLCF